MAWVCWTLGDPRRSVHLLKPAIDLLARIPGSEHWGAVHPAVAGRLQLTYALCALGEIPEAVEHAEEALRIAKGLNNPVNLVVGYLAVGHAYLTRGDLDQARPKLEEGLDLVRRWGIGSYLFGLTSTLGRLYARAGRLSEALALGEEAARIPELASASVLASLSFDYLAAGRSQDAAKAAATALDIARRHNQRSAEASALVALGKIATAADPPQTTVAEAYYQDATDIAKPRGLRPILASCHLERGLLYRKLGRNAEARAELTAAVAMFDEMTMHFWLERAQLGLCDMEASS